MKVTYFYFLKSALDDNINYFPTLSDNFLGDIGDYIEIDGVGYTIIDYAEEVE